MGKRKAAKKVQGPKKREKLDVVFACLFCNHEKSCSVTLDKKTMKGVLKCKVCGQGNVTEINYLSAAVDVYADWVDKCDEAAKANRDYDAAEQTASRSGGAARSSTQQPRANGAAKEREEMDDFIDADGEDDDAETAGHGGFGGADDYDDY